MGVPKNYQKTVNLNNRIKALNDLNFYTFKYKLNLTEEAITTIYENLGEDILETFEEFIGTITVNKTIHTENSGGEAFGEKRFSAVDDKKADEKTEEKADEKAEEKAEEKVDETKKTDAPEKEE